MGSSNPANLLVPRVQVWANLGGFSKILLIVLAFLCYQLVKARQRPPLPPGPKGNPFFGMTFRMPKVRPWIQFSHWARTYGPIMHVRVGLQHVIIVSSGRVARELLDNRHKNYSSRPPSRVGEIFAGNRRSVLMPYGDHLRRVRRTFNSIISSKKCDGYIKIQAGEAIATLREITEQPDRFADCIFRYSLSVARSVAFGRRVQHFDDNFVRDIKELMDHFSEVMLPGKFLFESIPALQLLPKFLKPWMQKLESYRDWETKLILREYRESLELSWRHPNRPSVARDLSREIKGKNDVEELQAATTCMEILGTGSDTTANSILVLIQACIAFPEVVKRAHEELDRVIGRERYPNWEDEPNLPYIRAMIKEQHRWRTIAPMSFSHFANDEDLFEGYRIPKGSIIRINTWAMQMDPKRYPNPDKYMPERFLEYKLSASAYANSPDVEARDHFSYGNGRRICVGIHLAERSLFNMVSCLLHTFDILPKLDEHGVEIPVDVNDYYSGLISGPCPFQARFVIRNEQIKATLNREWTDKFGNEPLDSWFS